LGVTSRFLYYSQFIYRCAKIKKKCSLFHNSNVFGSCTIIIIIIYQAVRRFHIFLRPLNTYSIFFLLLSLPFQSSSINPFPPSPHKQSSNPFRPGSFRSSSVSSSLWAPFHSLFWESSLFHSLNISIPFQLFSVNIKGNAHQIRRVPWK